MWQVVAPPSIKSNLCLSGNSTTAGIFFTAGRSWLNLPLCLPSTPPLRSFPSNSSLSFGLFTISYVASTRHCPRHIFHTVTLNTHVSYGHVRPHHQLLFSLWINIKKILISHSISRFNNLRREVVIWKINNRVEIVMFAELFFWLTNECLCSIC